MSIAKNIKELRISHQLSQSDFGRIAGVSDKAVSTWEAGKKVPRMGAIQRLADHFGISKSDIIEDNLQNTQQSSETLSTDEKKLLDYFRNFNQEGQERLLDTASDMAQLNRYKKVAESGVVAKEA